MPITRVGGLISGLDTDSIIKQIMDLERVPLGRLQLRRQAQVDRKNAWRDVHTRLYNLQTRAEDLRRLSTWNARMAGASDDAVASGAANSSAPLGDLDVEVVQLARTHQLAGGWVSSSTAALVDLNDESGEATIKVSTEAAGEKEVVLKHGMSLTDVKTEINKVSGIGVTASIQTLTVSGVTQHRLVLTSKHSGLRGGVTLTDSPAVAGKIVDDTNVEVIDGGILFADGTITVWRDGANTQAGQHRVEALSLADGSPGSKGVFLVNGVRYETDENNESAAIAGLRIRLDAVGSATFQVRLADTGDPATTPGVLRQLGVLQHGNSPPLGEELQAAQNARVKVNGTEYERSANTISDIIDGVTLTLKKAGSTTLTISRDLDAVVSAVKAFVSQFNSAADFIADKVSYDPKTKKAGTLFGETGLVQLVRDLRQAATDRVLGAADGFDRGSVVGLNTGKWDSPDRHHLVLDEAKLKAKLGEDPEAVAQLFGATPAGDDSAGIGSRTATKVKVYTAAATGITAGKDKSLEAQIKVIDDRIRTLEDRLERKEEQLRRQFTALERALSRLRSQGDRLAQQLLSLQGMSGGRQSQ